MNYANPTIHDVDVASRGVTEMRGLLDGLVTGSCNMLAVLATCEQALRDCRAELVAHHAELAERERHKAASVDAAQPITPPEAPLPPVPAERVLSFASLNGASQPGGA